jgi:hypothetical protein
MSEAGGYKLEQLMELAGLSCAQALQDAYPNTAKYGNVLVCCGPGNQVGLYQRSMRGRVAIEAYCTMSILTSGW